MSQAPLCYSNAKGERRPIRQPAKFRFCWQLDIGNHNSFGFSTDLGFCTIACGTKVFPHFMNTPLSLPSARSLRPKAGMWEGRCGFSVVPPRNNLSTNFAKIICTNPFKIHSRMRLARLNGVKESRADRLQIAYASRNLQLPAIYRLGLDDYVRYVSRDRRLRRALSCPGVQMGAETLIQDIQITLTTFSFLTALSGRQRNFCVAEFVWATAK